MCKQTFVVILLFGLIGPKTIEAVKFAYQPADYSAVEGKPAYFTCIFKGITDDMQGKYEVIWTKDSYIITEPSNGFDLKRFSFNNQYATRRHNLKIDTVTREDKGGYQCHLRFNENIDLISNTGELTVREIPSEKYPVVKFEKPTYIVGEDVMVRCFCEKTNPKPQLVWPSPGVKLLKSRLSIDNGTHMWIEATMPATVRVDGTVLDCQLIVENEVAPRYACTPPLRIAEYQNLKTKPAIPNTEDQPETSAIFRTSRMPLKREYMKISDEVGISNEGRSLLLSHYAIGIIGGLVCFIQLSL